MLIVLIAFLLYFFWPEYYEREQCTRKCRWENSKYHEKSSQWKVENIQGFILDFWNPINCKCVEITRPNLTIPYDKVSRYNEWADWKWNYDNSIVCKSENNNDNNNNENNEILHCGPCGKCSNKNDINVYDKLKFHLVTPSRNCAILSLIPPAFIGKYLSGLCFEYLTEFSSDCVDCWVDNFLCASIHCLNICIKEMMLGVDWNQGNEDNHGKLSPCFACDEYFCGPQFIDCAGVNRRSAGLHGDINRNDEQVCTKTKLYEKYKALYV